MIICNSVLDHLLVTDLPNIFDDLAKLLNPDGILYISFDREEEDDENLYKVLDNNQRLYIKGHNTGMIWKYFSDKEIENLLNPRFKILEYIILKNGRRNIWLINNENKKS